MKLVIDHLTRYGYDEEVKFSTQYLRLTPRSTGRQKITAWTLTLPDGGGDHHRRVGQCAACADAG
jgi:transglutaminase-like putative cysteine protease